LSIWLPIEGNPAVRIVADTEGQEDRIRDSLRNGGYERLLKILGGIAEAA
jgi:hypothetical protein